MLDLVIAGPKDTIHPHNKKKRFSKQVTIPDEVTLQGETREINGNIKKKGTDQTTNWPALNLEQVNQERSIFIEDEGMEVRNPSLSGRRREKVFILNKDLEPPDQGEQREKSTEEFKEAFQDIVSIETEMDIAYRKESRLVSSDDELTRGYINSEYHDFYKNKGKLVQQSITLFNNLSPRNYQNPGGIFIQTQESAEENKEVQIDPTPNVSND